jgi:hypothetical protein
MVEQRLHEIHTQTNQRIHFQCIQKDAHNATFQTRPKQSIKQPKQKEIWRVSQPDATKSMKVVKAPYLANRDRERGLTIYQKFGPNPILVFNAHSAAQRMGILFAREHSFWAQTWFVVLRQQRTRDSRFCNLLYFLAQGKILGRSDAQRQPKEGEREGVGRIIVFHLLPKFLTSESPGLNWQ